MRIIETEIFLIESGKYDEYYFAEYVPMDDMVYISATKKSNVYPDFVKELDEIENTIGINSFSPDIFYERLKCRNDTICLKYKKCTLIQ